MANVIPLTTPLAYGIKDFARLASISVRTLYSLWEQGKGPARKRVGGRVLITHNDGIAWLESQEAA